MFASEFYKQINGFTIGGRLSVIFSDLYMTKAETGKYIQTKVL